jgi:hypothetical protein
MQADGAGGADGARTTMDKEMFSACYEIFRTLWDSRRLCPAGSATDTVSYATLKKVVNKSLDCAGAPPRYKKVGRLVEGSGYRDAGDVARDQAFLNALEKCVRSSTGSSNMGNKSKPRVKWYTLDGDGPIEWPGTAMDTSDSSSLNSDDGDGPIEWPWESLPKDHLLAQPTPSRAGPSGGASSSDATRKDRGAPPERRERSFHADDAAGSADSTADSTADGAAGGEPAGAGRQLSAMSLDSLNSDECEPTVLAPPVAPVAPAAPPAVLTPPHSPAAHVMQPKEKGLECKRVKVFDGPNDGGSTVVDVESFVSVGEGYNVRFVEGIRAGERTLMKLKRYEVLGDAESAAPEHSRNRVSQ